ncbi:putative actin patch assembly and actin polymerization protein [Tulasnella sp. JGI-2019a]|nr:putative actin patch assembly and actin polymerization protein [Tulasnella sp. JGI-2019a]KAG9002456.1 putative actin patch assembly and actin polymerization protein [Tulasnella sp. JGI-2019a]KAG9034721.1 putative actin patch assembly and actin polymerization protein [Tulasnella sp. JGI-2019a]
MSKTGRLFGAVTGLTYEKPHSSITDWIEILSSDRYTENDLDGIPELVDSINLQPEGPTEAARAIRKKLKYGNVPRQIRALTILKALVENAGPKFQSSFANDALVTRIKTMATDPLTDETVKRKLMSVLGSWYRQFKDDRKMATVAGLWAQCGGNVKPRRPVSIQQSPPRETEDERATRAEIKAAKERAAREEEQERIRREAERKRKEKEEKQNKKKGGAQAAKGPTPKPFDFEKEKPLIITSIANASQASIHLTNALKLVNREQESIESNARVQECLANAKQCRKVIIRYIQRVENEEVIGTLLDVNERIIVSLQLYDKMLKSADHDSDEEDHDAADKMAALSVQSPSSEISKLQGKQRMAIERANSRSSLNVNSGGVSRPQGRTPHPDLNGLSWGEQSALPPPLRPRGPGDTGDDGYRQGSLSDYSDYSSEEEESHPSTAGSSHGHRDYRDLIGGDDDLIQDSEAGTGLLNDDDPFADPFGDGAGIPENLVTPMMEKRRQDVELR